VATTLCKLARPETSEGDGAAFVTGSQRGSQLDLRLYGLNLAAIARPVGEAAASEGLLPVLHHSDQFTAGDGDGEYRLSPSPTSAARASLGEVAR
jgi:hypothetical protein